MDNEGNIEKRDRRKQPVMEHVGREGMEKNVSADNMFTCNPIFVI